MPPLQTLEPSWSEWSACDKPLEKWDDFPHPYPHFPAKGETFTSTVFGYAMKNLEEIVKTANSEVVGKWCGYDKIGDEDHFKKVVQLALAKKNQ